MKEKVNKFGKTNWLLTISISLLLLAAVFLVWFLMRGETKIEGHSSEAEHDVSLSCEIEGIEYPFFRYDGSDSKKAAVVVVFDDDLMKSISLRYTLYYSDPALISTSESQNHASMNIDFGKNEMSADALSAIYSELKDSMVMSLYANANEFSEISRKYFFADGLNERSTIDDFKRNYIKQGFDCSLR